MEFLAFGVLIIIAFVAWFTPHKERLERDEKMIFSWLKENEGE